MESGQVSHLKKSNLHLHLRRHNQKKIKHRIKLKRRGIRKRKRKTKIRKTSGGRLILTGLSVANPVVAEVEADLRHLRQTIQVKQLKSLPMTIKIKQPKSLPMKIETSSAESRASSAKYLSQSASVKN